MGPSLWGMASRCGHGPTADSPSGDERHAEDLHHQHREASMVDGLHDGCLVVSGSGTTLPVGGVQALDKQAQQAVMQSTFLPP
jgi:hypothetical protein